MLTKLLAVSDSVRHLWVRLTYRLVQYSRNKWTENSHTHTQGDYPPSLPKTHWTGLIILPYFSECRAASIQQKYNWNPNRKENTSQPISEVDWVMSRYISNRRLNLKCMPALERNYLLPDMVIHICKCSWKFAHLILEAQLLLLLKGRGGESCLGWSSNVHSSEPMRLEKLIQEKFRTDLRTMSTYSVQYIHSSRKPKLPQADEWIPSPHGDEGKY